MGFQFILGALMMWSVWTTVDLKEITQITQDFSCCNLPIKIPVNRSHDHEFSNGKKSLVIATESTFTATPPFTVYDNNTLSLDKCEDYVQTTFSKNKRGFTEEKINLVHGQPCNSTAPDSQLHGPAALTGGIIAVVLVVVGVVGVTVCLCKKTSVCKKTNRVV